MTVGTGGQTLQSFTGQAAYTAYQDATNFGILILNIGKRHITGGFYDLTRGLKKVFNMSKDPAPVGPTPCGAKKIRDFDGPVFNNIAHTPQVHLIFWGSGWNTASTPTRTEIESKVTTLLNSNSKYFDALSQYRGVIKPVYGSSVTNTTFAVPSGDIGAFVPGDVVKDSIARGTVPNPDSTVNTDSLGHAFDRANIYAVMIPPGHDIPGFGGLHTNSGTNAGTPFAWLGIVWNACQTTNNNLPNPNNHLDNFTQAFSHELVDLLTDPIPANGVTGQNGFGYVGGDCPFGNPNLCEIAQTKCGNRQQSYNGVVIEAYWSDKDGACVIPGIDTNITSRSCMAGCHWDSSLGMCVSDSTGGGGEDGRTWTDVTGATDATGNTTQS